MKTASKVWVSKPIRTRWIRGVIMFDSKYPMPILGGQRTTRAKVWDSVAPPAPVPGRSTAAKVWPDSPGRAV